MNCYPEIPDWNLETEPVLHRFRFKDYFVDELMQITDLYCKENGYRMTGDARRALEQKVSWNFKLHGRSLGNGRYVKNLLATEVLKLMDLRVNKLRGPTLAELLTIEKEDIPRLSLDRYKVLLKKLHDMVGLRRLKESVERHFLELCLSKIQLSTPKEVRAHLALYI